MKPSLDHDAFRNEFWKIKCSECKNEQPVYSAATTIILCNACSHKLAVPTAHSIQLTGATIIGGMKEQKREEVNKDE